MNSIGHGRIYGRPSNNAFRYSISMLDLRKNSSLLNKLNNLLFFR